MFEKLFHFQIRCGIINQKRMHVRKICSEYMFDMKNTRMKKK